MVADNDDASGPFLKPCDLWLVSWPFKTDMSPGASSKGLVTWLAFRGLVKLDSVFVDSGYKDEAPPVCHVLIAQDGACGKERTCRMTIRSILGGSSDGPKKVWCVRHRRNLWERNLDGWVTPPNLIEIWPLGSRARDCMARNIGS